MTAIPVALCGTSPLPLLLLLVIGCAPPPSSRSLAAPSPQPTPDASLPIPPPMPQRDIIPSATPASGELVPIRDGDLSFTLFLPPSWRELPSAHLTLAIHFHGAPWFIIDEHLRRASPTPLLCVDLGQGSSVYRAAFEDPGRLERLLAAVESELLGRTPSSAPRITAIDVSSFSAGYGAVRELLKSPQVFRLIHRIILCDSMYAALEPKDDGPRRPAAAHIDPWIPFARAAAYGEKTFLLTYSQVPTTTYASTAECAAALVQAVGATFHSVSPGSLPATLAPDFPLVSRADLGSFHVWAYAGADAPAHLTHVRHLADLWNALPSPNSQP